MAPPRSLQWVSSEDGMDTEPVLALEPLSTILPGNYRHLQHPQALDRPTLFLGDSALGDSVSRPSLSLVAMLSQLNDQPFGIPLSLPQYISHWHASLERASYFSVPRRLGIL